MCAVWCGARPRSGNLARLLSQKVHEDELPKRHRVREVCFTAADLGYALHEFHECAITGEHERVDHYPRAPAVCDFLEGLADDCEVEAHRVLVDVPVGHRERAWLAVGD